MGGSRAEGDRMGTVPVPTLVRIRNGAIYALDELSLLLEEAEHALPEERRPALRRAVARASSSILEELINPLVREFPEVDLGDEEWETVALDRRAKRTD